MIHDARTSRLRARALAQHMCMECLGFAEIALVVCARHDAERIYGKKQTMPINQKGEFNTVSYNTVYVATRGCAYAESLEFICIANLLLSSILENQQQHRYNYTSGVYGVNPLCCNFIFCCHNHTKPHTKPDLYIRKHDNKNKKKQRTYEHSFRVPWLVLSICII